MGRAKQLDSSRLVTFVATGSGGHDASKEADIVCYNVNSCKLTVHLPQPFQALYFEVIREQAATRDEEIGNGR